MIPAKYAKRFKTSWLYAIISIYNIKSKYQNSKTMPGKHACLKTAALHLKQHETNRIGRSKMRKYLLPEGGQFYKANLHNHTSLSDGRLSAEEIKELYKRNAYSVVAYTDHDIFLRHNELCDESFVALNGFEMEIDDKNDVPYEQMKTAHVCFIALDPDNAVHPCWHRTKYLFANAVGHRDEVVFDENEPDYERRYTGECVSDIFRRAAEAGFFGTYNHPTWSMENYEDYINYNGMHAIEMFNGTANVGGFEDYNPRVYDDMLRSGKRIFCIGADDNHNAHPENSRLFDSCRAFTMIKAEKLEYRAITSALEAGSFYTSEAPEIHSLYIEGNKLHIKTTQADSIVCIYNRRRRQIVADENGSGVYEAVFELPENYIYFRLTVTDKQGKHACTNAYFKDTLFG